MNILLWIILGGIAGWVADTIMKNNHNLIEDIILGIIGGFVGGLLMNSIGQPGITGLNIYSMAVAIVGAISLIFLGNILHR